jgi:hypothetical protein
MKKLTLEPESLRVESFEPQPKDADEKGTVLAQQATRRTLCFTCGCPSPWPEECA